MSSPDLKTQIIQKCVENEIQISKQALDKILKNNNSLDSTLSLIDKVKNNNEFIILPEHVSTATFQKTSFQILKNYNQEYNISGIEDMSAYFLARLEYFKKQLQNRLQSTVSITNVKKSGRDKLSLIAIVSEKRKTEKGNFIFEIEDFSGQIRAIATKEKVRKEAESIVHDDILGFTGSSNGEVFFIDEFTWPDMPLKESKKELSEDTSAIFLSDTHIGSKKFLKDRFQTMIDWLNGKMEAGKYPTERIPNIKYLFIAGDLVDGVGVYPTQLQDLEIVDVFEQYTTAAKILSQIPEEIQIIIGPGNHDFVRGVQPQPAIPKEIAPALYELPNVAMVSSPSMVKLENNNSSLNVLVYHGTTMDAVIHEDPNLKDGYKHPEKVMAALLKRRHLCPQYDAGLVPQPNNGDPLIIPEAIDIFQTGHVHSNGALNYRGVTLINGGTWQDKTEFQEFLGHEPTPCRLPIINLKDRQITQLHF